MSTVNAVCDLASMDPAKCLPMAPLLFKFFQSTPDNWITIKLIKLVSHIQSLYN